MGFGLGDDRSFTAFAPETCDLDSVRFCVVSRRIPEFIPVRDDGLVRFRFLCGRVSPVLNFDPVLKAVLGGVSSFCVF